MLKNKKIIYLLIPLNIAVWGFFVYRFWTAYHQDGAAMDDAPVKTAAAKIHHDSSTYHLALNYKDPFLKENERLKSYSTGNVQATAKRSAPAPVPAKAPAVAAPVKQMPDLKYLGLIKNNSSGMIAGLVMVNGQSRLIKPNESAEGFFFKSFNKDSLVARYGQEKIVVTR